MQCEDIIAFLELEAPLFLQEEYDNSGLQWGNPEKEIEKVLICLDFSQEALKTAIKEKAQFIISHHPILFKPMKQIHTGFGKGAMLADCIREDICVYAAHTNFDAAGKGLNEYLAKKLDLLHISGLNLHFREALYKLVVFIPAESLEKVQDAVYKAGAGWIGNYSDCGFSVKGIGTFKPLKGTNPYVGKQGELETVDEYRLETVVPEHRLNDVVKSMLEAHPYEEAAYDMYRMEKKGYEYSLGRVGNLKKSMKTDEFVQYVKNRLQAPNVRTVGNRKDVINRVAVFCKKKRTHW